MTNTSAQTQVSFIEAVKIVALQKYADFSGRASRSEFWWWLLFTVLVTSALNVFSAISISDSADLGRILVSIWSIATLVPNLAVGVRRLRDASYPWQYLFFGLIPVAGIVILLVFMAQPTKKTA